MMASSPCSSLTGANMMKRCLVFVLAVFASFAHAGASDAERVSVPVMEGDSFTLHTGTNMTISTQERIVWYFNGIRIALMICTDVECKEVTERFRDRLKLDHHTGDLTITNITNTDDGDYHQSMNIKSDTYFNVSVHGVSAAERDEMRRKSVTEGESVTLDPGEIKTNGVMMWYYNDTLIAEITGDQSEICTDVQCDERFRDRLKLDQGYLTIMNTRTEDSGEYKLQINNSRFSIIRSFSVSVTGSGLFAAVVAGICVAVLLVSAIAAVAAGVGVIYCRRKISRNEQESRFRDLRGSQRIRVTLPRPYPLTKPLMGNLSLCF